MALNQLRRIDLAVRRRLTLADFAERMADVWGERPLVEQFGGDSMTYAEAARRVVRWSNGIAALITTGDRVVLATPNAYEQFLLCLAVSRAGGLPVPVNPQMRRSEIDHVVADSGAAMVLTALEELDPDAPACEPATPDRADVAALFYTSGTTGKPKGAALTTWRWWDRPRPQRSGRCSSATTMSWWRCRWRTSWGSSRSSGSPRPGSACTSWVASAPTTC